MFQELPGFPLAFLWAFGVCLIAWCVLIWYQLEFGLPLEEGYHPGTFQKFKLLVSGRLSLAVELDAVHHDFGISVFSSSHWGLLVLLRPWGGVPQGDIS